MTLREMIINTEKGRIAKQLKQARLASDTPEQMRIADMRTLSTGGWTYQDCASCRGIFDKYYFFLYNITNYDYNHLYEQMMDWDFTEDELLNKTYLKFGIDVDEIIAAFFASKFPNRLELLKERGGKKK